MTTTITLDAKALREIARAMQTRMLYIVNELRGDASGLKPLNDALLEMSAQADAYDAAHPDDPCVWQLHGPDAEPSPILRIETPRGPASIDVRAIVGDVIANDAQIRAARISGGDTVLDFLPPFASDDDRRNAERDAQAALDRIHAARVAHDDQHAEDRRHARIAEAVGKAVAAEIRAADLQRCIREALERLTMAPEPERVPTERTQPQQRTRG